MTEREQEAWAESLGPSPSSRLATLSMMLRHANGDGMTAEDRAICRRWYAKIYNQVKLRAPRADTPVGGQHGSTGTRSGVGVARRSDRRADYRAALDLDDDVVGDTYRVLIGGDAWQ